MHAYAHSVKVVEVEVEDLGVEDGPAFCCRFVRTVPVHMFDVH